MILLSRNPSGENPTQINYFLLKFCFRFGIFPHIVTDIKLNCSFLLVDSQWCQDIYTRSISALKSTLKDRFRPCTTEEAENVQSGWRF